MQALVSELAQTGYLRKAYFDTPRTLYQVLSVFILHGTGLRVAPLTWKDRYYVITKASLDQSQCDGTITGYLVNPKRQQLGQEGPLERSFALASWTVVGREFDPVARLGRRHKGVSSQKS